jgi:diacylglycerol kinase family enzyme
MLTSQLYQSGGAKHFKTSSLRLYSAVPVPFHVEGENAGWLPAEFGVRANTLRVIVP